MLAAPPAIYTLPGQQHHQMVTFHVAQSASAPKQPSAPTALDVEDPQQPSEVVIQPNIAELKRLKTLRDLAPSSPAMKLFTDTISLVIDMFRLSMASMLAVFVPQLCPSQAEAEADGYYGCTHEVVQHDCTFQENFICLSQFNKAVLSWNFICLGVLVFHYFLVWRRENFLIKYFRETLTEGRLHIRDVLQDYPTLKRRLGTYNSAVFYTSVIAIGLQVANVVLSGILVMRYYNNGYKTFTTFFTNMLVLMMVLYTCLSAAFIGMRHELAYSCIAIEPVSYNAVAPDAKRD